MYLDFAKAFDKVSHSKLLSKLQRIGIGGNLFRVIKSYLTNRKQYVQLGSVKFSLLEIASGVPQGSLLGPLLFLINFMDLPVGISTVPYMFADDSKLLDILKRNAYSPAQEDLQILERWCTANSMAFNASKCHMTFGTNSQSPALKLNNIYLEQSRSEKDLGTTVSDTLKWTSHVQKVCDKANKVFHMVKRNVSRLLPYQQKLHLYKSMVLPILCYGSPAWCPSKTDMRNIESVQRRATNWIIDFNDLSYKERLTALNLLRISLYLQVIDLLFFSRLINGDYMINLDHYLSSTPASLYATRSSTTLRYSLRKKRLDISRTKFWHRVPRLCNLLPDYVNFHQYIGLKSRLLKFLWSYFNNNFDIQNTCSWRFACNCNLCRNVIPR